MLRPPYPKITLARAWVRERKGGGKPAHPKGGSGDFLKGGGKGGGRFRFRKTVTFDDPNPLDPPTRAWFLIHENKKPGLHLLRGADCGDQTVYEKLLPPRGLPWPAYPPARWFRRVGAGFDAPNGGTGGASFAVH